MIMRRTISGGCRAMAMAIALLLSGAAAATAQPLAVRITELDISQFPSVRLHIDVIRDRNIVFNPAAANYTLLENGVVQNIDRLDCAYDSLTRLSVALLIDRSGSMAEKIGPMGFPIPDRDTLKLNSAKAAVRTFISRLGDKDEAAVFSFSSQVGGTVQAFTVNQNFTKDTTLLKNCLVPIVALGSTYLWSAVKNSIASLRTRSGRKYLIVLTDGRSTYGDDTRQSAIAAALAAKVPVYTIGLGADVSTNELTDIANQTGGRYYYAPGPGTLDQIYLELSRIILTDGCDIRYISSDACLDGTRRDISLTVSGNGYSAEADTFFVVPDNLSTYTLSIERTGDVIAGDSIDVPLHLREFISQSEPLNFDLALRYDTALLANPRLSLAGTIAEGAPVSLQEPSPGSLRLRLAGFLPARTSGVLLDVIFTTRILKSDTLAPVDFASAVFAQSCPTRLVLENGGVSITPCRGDYVLSGDSLIYASSGGTAEAPIRIDPPPRPGEPTVIGFDIFYDPALVTIDSIAAEGTIAGAMQATLTRPAPGVLRVRLEGIVPDGTDLLLRLPLSFAGSRESVLSGITLANLLLESRCVTTLAAVPFRLLVEGSCERIAVPVAAVPAIRNNPNPFNPSTEITFSIPRDGRVRLEVRDMSGQRVAALLDDWRPAGEYRLSFDASGLPSGSYVASLLAGGKETHRTMILIR